VLHLVRTHHNVYLTTDVRGRTLARVEWTLLLSAERLSGSTDAQEIGRESLVPVYFSADAAELHQLGQAMLACASAIDAIDACASPADFEFITLTEHGIAADGFQDSSP